MSERDRMSPLPRRERAATPGSEPGGSRVRGRNGIVWHDSPRATQHWRAGRSQQSGRAGIQGRRRLRVRSRRRYAPLRRERRPEWRRRSERRRRRARNRRLRRRLGERRQRNLRYVRGRSSGFVRRAERGGSRIAGDVRLTRPLRPLARGASGQRAERQHRSGEHRHTHPDRSNDAPHYVNIGASSAIYWPAL